MTEQIAKVEFSNWFQWEAREEYDLIQHPGVYAIAISRENLTNHSFSWKDVVYLGMTQKQGLRARLNNFNRVIQGKKGFHSGAKSVFEKLGAYKTEKWQGMSLYVAMMGIECNPQKPQAEDYRRMGLIAYLEYEAFAVYHELFRGHPKYNTQ